MAQLLNGKAIAATIVSELKEEIKRLGIRPGLAVLLVGDDGASHMYVALKEKAAAAAGMHFEKILLPKNIEEELVLAKIDELNRKPDIHGIVVQLPLPPQLNENHITQAMFPEKDADGFHPKNIELLLAGTPRVVPNLLQGILRLIETTGVSLAEKTAVILSNSNVFTTPLAKLLADKGLLVTTIIAPAIKNNESQIANHDIIITALGRPHAITKDMIQEGAIVIDVGTTRVDGKILGDVHPNVSEKAGWLTPVPGGVGPLTVAYLLKNVVEAAKRKNP